MCSISSALYDDYSVSVQENVTGIGEHCLDLSHVGMVLFRVDNIVTQIYVDDLSLESAKFRWNNTSSKDFVLIIDTKSTS